MSDTISKYWEMVEDGTMEAPTELRNIHLEKQRQKAIRNLRLNNPDEIKKFSNQLANETENHSSLYDLAESFEKMLITFLK